MSRGNDKREMFVDDIDYGRYLVLLKRSSERFNVGVIAYCLMPNHVHLLVKPHDYPLSRMMQHLNSAYCGWFNRRHQRVGHVLQGRYKSQIVESGPSFVRVLRYIVMNPVAAGKVPTPAAWSWSSYLETVGLSDREPLLVLTDIWQVFDSLDNRDARRAFQQFIEGAGADQRMPSGFLIGSDGFIRGFEPVLVPFRSNRELVHAERYASRPPLAELMPVTTRGPDRDQGAHRAFHTYAYTLREIGDHTSVSPSAVWLWTRRHASAA